MARLSELNAKARLAKTRETLDGLLRTLDVPVSTSEIVKRIAAHLGANAEEQFQIARDLQRMTTTHDAAHRTEETFVRYGRTMYRWEWWPSHATKAKNAPIRLTDGELARRRTRIAELEDPWTINPEPEFLDED